LAARVLAIGDTVDERRFGIQRERGPLFEIVKEHVSNPEFKERADIAALMLGGSETIH
jgi:hypothetical protein